MTLNAGIKLITGKGEYQCKWKRLTCYLHFGFEAGFCSSKSAHIDPGEVAGVVEKFD